MDFQIRWGYSKSVQAADSIEEWVSMTTAHTASPRPGVCTLGPLTFRPTLTSVLAYGAMR
jgi:hypothetical protein